MAKRLVFLIAIVFSVLAVTLASLVITAALSPMIRDDIDQQIDRFGTWMLRTLQS